MPISTASEQSKQLSPKRAKPKNGPSVHDKITNYASALRWLYLHADYERMRFVSYNTRTFNLSRMRRLLAALGDPHEQIKCVQVAGTKGKGSTCAMLGSMLRACGYTVGSFTSPHLVDLRERIEIDGQMINHPDLTSGRGAGLFEIDLR